MYMCDTETVRRGDHVAVWLIDSCEIGTYEHIQHTDLSAWLDWALEKSITCYFHNLRYDGAYIVDFLLSEGYKYSDAKELGDGEFFVLVTDLNQWFKIIINKGGKTVVIYDSLKKIPLSVRSIAKAYKMPMTKGEIDYKAERPEGYTPTAEEIDYITRDTEIVARALKNHFDKGMTKISAPADALEEFKHTCFFKKYFATDFYTKHPEIDEFCRKAYCGGISWVNPLVKDLIMLHGLVYDYNSMYSSVMLAYTMPLFEPRRFYNKPEKGWMYIARCYIDITRQPGKPACIRDPLKKAWIEDSFQGEIYLTSVDIENLEKCYYGSYKILDGYQWKGVAGIFEKYITHWRALKESSTGGERQIAKLMLNSLYGKFGTNPQKAKKKPVLIDGVVHWQTMEEEYTYSINVAVAAFITAYARRELVNGILDIDGVFCYCDTDSIHMASAYQDSTGKIVFEKAAAFHGKVDEKSFGAWKCEGRFVRAKYLRQKTYIEEHPNGSLTIAACGCPDESRKYITFENFKIGASYKGKLMQRTVKGGCELVEKRFTIREPIRSF